MLIKAILAHDDDFGIGKYDGLPWPHNKADMDWFAEHTRDDIVVMGRKTWESIGCRALKNRINLILTRSDIVGDYDGIYRDRDNDMGKILVHIEEDYKDYPHENVWIIGGTEVYKQALPFCDEVSITHIHGSFGCDTFIDPLLFERFDLIKAKMEFSDLTFTLRGITR